MSDIANVADTKEPEVENYLGLLVSGKLILNRPYASTHEGGRDIISVVVGHCGRGPNDPETAGGPNFPKDLGSGSIESPFFDKLRHEATYDMNKEIFDDLGGGLTIVVGRGYSK